MYSELGELYCSISEVWRYQRGNQKP